MALWVFFFPWTRKAGEEEAATFPSPSLSPRTQKDADPKPPLA